MKQFLIKSLVFFLIFFVAEKSICFFIENAPKKEYDKRLEHLLKGEINKDIVILGSSRGANNIIAEQLQQDTNKSVFNLSYKGSDLIFQEFIFKTLIDFNNKPELLILVLDDIHTFKTVPSLNFRTDVLMPLKNYNYINNELIKRNDKNILSKYFCLSRVNRNDFDLNEVKVKPEDEISILGSNILINRKIQNLTFSDGFEIYSEDSEDFNKINALKNIQLLCKEYQIDLVFTFAPSYKTFNQSFLHRFKKLAIEENRILVYDTLNPIYKNDTYFADDSHLLKNGAIIFTSEITTFVNNLKR
ncbi:hypothetical protein [Mariniflexile sp.]|uniref:hypothetical protein n=1 Tax=Mariniflexile sp. TaxID=1979402 RepID=UPI003568264E